MADLPVESPDPVDPTRVREQPSLTTSSGTIWLVVGGLFAAISLVVLIPMTALAGGGVALAAVVGVAVLYVGMVVTRLVARPGRRRLAVLAWAMILMAVVALGAVIIVAYSEWDVAVG